MFFAMQELFAGLNVNKVTAINFFKYYLEAMDDSVKVTTNRREIIQWTKERGGVPAFFFRHEETDLTPRLRIKFASDEMDDRMQEIPWERVFEELEDRRLAFKYREVQEDGTPSTYCEFVSR